MKERLVTLGLALGALSLFYVLFLPKPEPAGSPPSMPLSGDSRSSGYQAAWRWLEAQRIPVLALRDRYDVLNSPEAAFKPTGNVMFTTLPHALPVRPQEATQLDAWVARGNTLVVLAALDDTPLWALGDTKLVEAVGRLTRLKFAVIKGEKSKDAAGGRPRDRKKSLSSMVTGLLQSENVAIEPRGDHPLMADVHSVQVVSELPASRWRATPMDRAAVLQIGQIADNADPAVWLRREGRGEIITFAVASIFGNQAIGERDNARLLSNLVGWSLNGGAVIFDDAHQGSVSYYDAKAFFRDPRLHRTLGWIVFLWFVFVLGVQRLRLRPRDWNPTDITAFVAVSGEFLASTLPPGAVGTRLFENFFNVIRRRIGLTPDGSPVWEWLSAQAGAAPAEVAQLRRLHQRIQAGRRVDLTRLQSILSQLQGKLI